MKKQSKIFAIISLIIVVCALAFAIVNQIAFKDFLVHPILNFLLFNAVCFGVLLLVCALLKKSPWHFFLSAGLICLSALYLILSLVKPWWISLIVVISLIAIFVIISYLFCGCKTEEISLNKSTDYKNYKQREKEEETEEEVPQIKSFK